MRRTEPSPSCERLGRAGPGSIAPWRDRGTRWRSGYRHRQSGAKQQTAASGADGRQQPLRRVADDQEEGPRRRLLDHLQQRVGARDRQVLGAVDDADAVAPIGGCGAEHVEGLADRVDGDRGGGRLLVGCRRAAQDRQIRDGTAPRPAAPPGIGPDVEVASMDRSRLRIGIEDGAGDPIGQRRLADPLRPADEPGMVQAAAAAMPSRKAPRPSAWPKKANCSRGCGAPSRPSGSSAASTSRDIAAAFAGCVRSGEALLARPPRSPPRPRPRSRSASITTQRAGSAAAIARKAWRSASWKDDASPSKRSDPSPLAWRRDARSRQAGFGRQIEDEGQVGLVPSTRRAPARRSAARRHRPSALVGPGRIRKAVAQTHESPARRAGRMVWSR